MAADGQVGRSILVYQSAVDKIRYDLMVDECQLVKRISTMHAAELFFKTKKN